MKKFAIAFTSLHDNDLQITFATGIDEVDVAINFLEKQSFATGTWGRTLDSIKESCFDGDCLIEVKEVP